MTGKFVKGAWIEDENIIEIYKPDESYSEYYSRINTILKPLDDSLDERTYKLPNNGITIDQTSPTLEEILDRNFNITMAFVIVIFIAICIAAFLTFT